MMLQNPEFLVLLPLALLALKLIPRGENYTRKVAGTRTLVIVLLVAAAAGPAITQVKQATTEQKINILIDNTTSARVLEKNVPVDGTRTVFIQGNNSRIFSQAASTIEQGSYNLLVTDGQTEEQTSELVKTAKRKNATVSIYRPETRVEAAVRIEGPFTTVLGAQNTFQVKISSTREKPVPVNITLDGEVIYTGKINDSYSFNRKFQLKGQHTIQAAITSNDIFTRNNRYYKTVEVREKPEILAIGKTGILEQNLKKFYEVDNRQNLPENLEDYYTVIMKKPLDSQRLRNYIADGNGLMYTGSMERIPSYLPVQKDQKEDEEAGARVIILIDISASTGSCQSKNTDVCFKVGEQGKVSKESLRIAYSLVDTLKKSNEVGVVAYNRESYLVSEPKSLAYSRKEIKRKISKISPSGPSFHDLGIRGAASLAEKNDTVVMLSDGRIGVYNRQNIAFKTRTEANAMEAKLITVGMGEDPNKPLLKDIAKTTGGYYLENKEAGRLKFRFGSGGGESQYTPIAVVNPNHFITEGLELDGATTGFKPVKTKRSANTLVSGSNGKEFLSTWRYGLGRVAAFSAGGKNLDRTVKTDPGLISRTVSWTVGNPQRKKDRWLDVSDASRPEKPEVSASYQLKGLTRQSRDLYIGELEKPGLGIHSWRNETYAYNYHPEIRKIGLNQDKLSKIAQKTGGSIFDFSNAGEINEEVEEIDRTVRQQVSLAPFLLLAALIVFLAEVGYRKMNGRL
ncbi:MAG: hypothetical protein ABEK16_00650 [Candidatus Nanohalobium sp.]